MTDTPGTVRVVDTMMVGGDDWGRMANHKFVDVEWGPDEAKGDVRLPSYFVRIPEFDSILSGGHRYVIGRKGMGKTAVLERIRQMADESPTIFHSELSLRSFPIQTFRALKDRAYRDKSQFVPIWTFLFAVELARLVLKDNSVESSTATIELREFLERNQMLQEVGFGETVTRLKSHQSKVNVLARWIGAELSEQTQDTIEVPIHYQRATELLLERLERVPSDCTFYLLIDELDEGYSAGDTGIRLLLLSLLRATEETALRLQAGGLQFRPIVALRSDIFDGLEDNDLNKLDDLIVRICWQTTPYGDYSLRQVVDARIRASLSLAPDSRAWDAVADDKDPRLPKAVDSLWSYICSRTFGRPRDLVKFLKLCRTHVGSSERLSYEAVTRAERDFSDWLYRELRDEIHTYLPVWREALQCITAIGTGIFAADRLARELNQDHRVLKWMNENSKTTEDVFEALFDFGVIGNLTEQGMWLFHYKDPDLVWNPGMKVIVHFGFHKKLRLKGSKS